MRLRAYVPVACALLLSLATIGRAKQVPDSTISIPIVVQETLIAPGNPPFDLKADIFEGRDTEPIGHVEIFWVAPDKWRRTIESNDFSQTLIVNGNMVFEQDSNDYFPIELNTLVTAMVNPKMILNAHRPQDQLETKANGASSESGMVCFGKFCSTSPYGLTEIVGTPGHSVSFSSYQKFKGMEVARRLTDTVGVGEFLRAQVTGLKDLKHPDNSLFTVVQPTPQEEQIRTIVLPETGFRSLALETHEIMWPQVLDGATVGTASYYVSTDRSGRVREVLPVYTDNERANDSARRQIMKWKFKPAVQDGFPAQAESILTFSLNTRAWGPPDPLSDAEARKLASNIVLPVFPPGRAPSGASCSVRVAIDSDGILIEAIPGEGVQGVFDICFGAVRQWHFSPILQNGEPRPYRAEIKFQIP